MQFLKAQNFAALTFVLSLGACGKIAQDTSSWLKSSRDKILSNRPQSSEKFFAVLRLKSAPLFSSATRDASHKTHVDMKLAQKIAEEQAALIAELAALSPDIKIIYRYRLLVNGITIVAPSALKEKIEALSSIASLDTVGDFDRPVVLEDDNKSSRSLSERNSVKFIGAEAARKQGLRGRGLKVGIIDTGIDYTHSMLGGPGTVEAYNAIDPSLDSSLFPNKKVVGGIDLVGSAFNSAAAEFDQRIPTIDNNPIDESGHGSHVAGTVAGIGDGVQSYDGVAPDADLYAIKVFGKNGSTSATVVVAALEYAADPNGDLDFSDQLDVVNLSLGSGYGSPQSIYGEAIRNLVSGGTSVVASGGNSGPVDYIVGAPGVIDEALSVAASVDNADHNWNYAAVRFKFSDGEIELAEAIEGPVSKPIAELGDVSGELVFVGLADQDFSDEIKSQLQGKIALIDRGGVAFVEKIKRAVEAGAKGAVVANNQDAAPIPMGGSGDPYAIPAVMVTKALGTKIKERLLQASVIVDFKSGEVIAKPENIDTLTSFSSKGPRSGDGFLKPEISAPGSLIISAAFGQGSKARSMSGTSMSAPHMAGVMALLKQKFPTLTPLELKALAMGHSKTIADQEGTQYLLSRQGSGRVQIAEALSAQLIALDPSLSFGETTIEGQKVLRRSIRLKNISNQELHLKPTWVGHKAISISSIPTISLAVGSTQTLNIEVRIDARDLGDVSHVELDGFVKFLDSSGVEKLRVPTLAVINKLSAIQSKSLLIQSQSSNDAAGAAVTLSLSNESANNGKAFIFNNLGNDARKVDFARNPFVSRACDLQASGYRIIEKSVNGQKTELLQIAVKLFDPLTTWHNCEISVLIDSDGDQIPEQELVGVMRSTLNGLTGKDFVSILLDAPKTRALRKSFESQVAAGDPKPEEDYSSAVLSIAPMTLFAYSSIAIVEVDSSLLARRANGKLAIKVLSTHQEAAVLEFDDYLGNPNAWKTIDISRMGQSYFAMPESSTLAGGANIEIELTKGAGREALMLLVPNNRPTFASTGKDAQLMVPKAKYLNQ